MVTDKYTQEYRVRQLVGMLYALKAVRKGEFTLSSGKKSDFYIDGRLAALDPETLRVIAPMMGAIISPMQFDSVGAPEGPGSCALLGSLLLGYGMNAANMTISGFIVRKKAKEHGMAKILEGRVGDRPVLIDDVATSGKALLHAISHMPTKPIAAVVLLDRGEGAKEALHEVGVELMSVLTMKDLIL